MELERHAREPLRQPRLERRLIERSHPRGAMVEEGGSLLHCAQGTTAQSTGSRMTWEKGHSVCVCVYYACPKQRG